MEQRIGRLLLPSLSMSKETSEEAVEDQEDRYQGQETGKKGSDPILLWETSVCEISKRCLGSNLQASSTFGYYLESLTSALKLYR